MDFAYTIPYKIYFNWKFEVFALDAEGRPGRPRGAEMVSRFENYEKNVQKT